MTERWCYYGLNGQLSSRDLSRTTKLILCKALIVTVLLTDVTALWLFERKVLRKIFGPVCVGDNFRIRYNSELYELLNDMDVVHHINIQRLRWLDHVFLVEDDAPVRRVFDTGISGEEDDLVFVGRTKSRKPCHRFLWPTGVDPQDAEAEIR